MYLFIYNNTNNNNNNNNILHTVTQIARYSIIIIIIIIIMCECVYVHVYVRCKHGYIKVITKSFFYLDFFWMVHSKVNINTDDWFLIYIFN